MQTEIESVSQSVRNQSNTEYLSLAMYWGAKYMRGRKNLQILTTRYLSKTVQNRCIVFLKGKQAVA